MTYGTQATLTHSLAVTAKERSRKERIYGTQATLTHSLHDTVTAEERSRKKWHTADRQHSLTHFMV
jgi:hypothetical protein